MRAIVVKKLDVIFPGVKSTRAKKRMWNALNWKERTKLMKGLKDEGSN